MPVDNLLQKPQRFILADRSLICSDSGKRAKSTNNYRRLDQQAARAEYEMHFNLKITTTLLQNANRKHITIYRFADCSAN